MSNEVNVYDKAREVLRERGRAIGDLVDPVTGFVCLIGALRVAAYGEVSSEDTCLDPVNRPVAQVIREQFPDRAWTPLRSTDALRDATTVYDFNDSSITIDDEVDLVLDKAARVWDEQVRS